MRIVEKDFIIEPVNHYLFNLIYYKKVKNPETGEIEIKKTNSSYGCSLASILQNIIRFRTFGQFESENPCLLEFLEALYKENKKLVELCKESLPENFDTGD